VSSSVIGPDTLNCTNFTLWYLASCFGVGMTVAQLQRWMVPGPDIAAGNGWSPRVAAELGMGVEVDIRATRPEGGVFLVQAFSDWPAGHNLMILDYDRATDKFLTLEASDADVLDGVGARGLGNLRDLVDGRPPADWAQRLPDAWWTSWSRYTARRPQATMTRLDFDHVQVRSWRRAA
jgi:hypothetical protein